MEIKQRKALVTGAAGFIGSHLVDRLLSLNCQVVAIDDLSNGKIEYLQDALHNKRFRFIKGTVVDNKLIRKVVNDGIEVIFHLASGNLLTSLEDPKLDVTVTIQGTLNILEAIKERSSKTVLIFSSTGSVYGEPKYQPQDENHPLEPVSPYGISKLAAEKYVLLWHKIYGLQTSALRYYNVYGPRQNYKEKGGVVGIFINRIKHDKPPIIEGTGKQERCFTFVSDVVEANIRAATYDMALGQAINIGTTEITTIHELAYLILKCLNSKLKPTYVPRRIGDIDEFRPSLQKAKKLLRYTPKVKLIEGINKTIEWFNSK